MLRFHRQRLVGPSTYELKMKTLRIFETSVYVKLRAAQRNISEHSPQRERCCQPPISRDKRVLFKMDHSFIHLSLGYTVSDNAPPCTSITLGEYGSIILLHKAFWAIRSCR